MTAFVERLIPVKKAGDIETARSFLYSNISSFVV